MGGARVVPARPHQPVLPQPQDQAPPEFPPGSPLTFLRSNSVTLNVYDEDPGADDAMGTVVFNEVGLT